jgi:transcriptional regulator with XRE-family HTH domain
MQLVHQRTVDLEYLLAPQNWEEDDGRARKIGRRLREMRKEKQCTIEQAAQDLGVSPQNIKALERATADRKVSFQAYVNYTYYLGVTLHSLFAQVFSPSTPSAQIEQHCRVGSNNDQFKQAKRQQREQDLLDQVKKASQDFKALGLPITLEAICKKVHITPQNLKMYPSILAWWEEVSIDLRDEAKQRENELVYQVQLAILTLQTHGQVVSIKAICAFVLRSRSQLLFSPRVNLLIKQALGKKSSIFRPSNLPEENHILEEIQAAIAFLKTSGQFLTQKAISKRVGLSPYMLQLYPRAKAILDQVAEEGRLQRKQLKELRGQEIAERVQQAIAQLKDSGQIVTQQAIAEIVGYNQAVLRRYESVRPLLSQIAKEYQQYISQRRQQHESALMEQMPRAIQYLQETEQPITLITVGKLLGFSSNALTDYPNLRRLYHQVLDEKRQVREQQAQQREEALLERIHHTIQQLKGSNQPVRLKTIAESAGMTVASLLKYPRIKVLLQQITEERRKKKRETNIKQDQQLPVEIPECRLF